MLLQTHGERITERLRFIIIFFENEFFLSSEILFNKEYASGYGRLIKNLN